jgi:hypothetical protein
MGVGTIDQFALTAGISPEDIASIQMRADYNSLFNNKIYVDFEAPNKFAVRGINNLDVGGSLKKFKVLLLIKHADSLMTISPTKMEIFEKLAKADIALYLYNNLKYYEGLETVFASVQLRLEDLKEEADKREQVEQEIKDSYVSAANDYAPMIMCI